MPVSEPVKTGQISTDTRDGTPAAGGRSKPDAPRQKLPGWVKAAGILVALGHGPVLLAFFLNLWSKPHYQFFPLAMLAAVFLGWSRIQALKNPFAQSASGLAAGFLLLALAFLGFNVFVWSPWLGAVATLCSLTGVVLWLGGIPLAKALIPSGLMLLTMIPPPLQYDVRLTLGLQRMAVSWSSTFMDLLNIPHVQLGNTIEVPGQQLLVDEACSGINSVLSVSAFALFYGLWRRRSALQILSAGIAGLAFVLMGNLVRILSGAWLKYIHGVDILSGWPHAIIGLLLFAVYLALVVSFYSLLDGFSEIWNAWRRRTREYLEDGVMDAKDEQASAAAPANSAARRFSPALVFAAAVLFASLGVAHGVQAWKQRAQLMQLAKIEMLPSALKNGGQFTLPDQIGSWQKVSLESQKKERVETVAQFSHYWAYRHRALTVFLALDFPYQGAHDLTVCYRNSGWSVPPPQVYYGPNRSQTPPLNPAFQDGPYVEVPMLRPPLGFGMSWFSHLSIEGRWVELPSFASRFKREDPTTTFQIQALVHTFAALDADLLNQSRQLFLEVRQQLAPQILAQLKAQK